MNQVGGASYQTLSIILLVGKWMGSALYAQRQQTQEHQLNTIGHTNFIPDFTTNHGPSVWHPLNPMAGDIICFICFHLTMVVPSRPTDEAANGREINTVLCVLGAVQARGDGGGDQCETNIPK